MKKQIVLEDLLTIDEVAPKIGMSPKTIRNKIFQGVFPVPFIKDGGIKFRPSDINAYLEKRTVNQTK